MLSIPGTFPTLKGLLIGLAVVLMVAPVAYCQGRTDGKSAVEAKIERANAAAHKLNLELHDAAAEKRAVDATANSKQELEDAKIVAENPGGILPPAAVGLACRQLRSAGIDGADLPPGC
jgi:hypothetical protein